MESGNNGKLDGVYNTSKENKSEGGAIGWLELMLRVLALVLTLVAAILLGVNKQIKIVPLKLTDDLPALNVPVTAKTSYVSAFVYFVVANSIACAVTAITLALAFAIKGRGRGVSYMMIVIIDLMMVALLFSSVGAAGSVGLIGMKGNSHLRWNKVCNVYGKFCHQVMASVGLSLLGATTFVILVFIAITKLIKRA